MSPFELQTAALQWFNPPGVVHSVRKRLPGRKIYYDEVITKRGIRRFSLLPASSETRRYVINCRRELFPYVDDFIVWMHNEPHAYVIPCDFLRIIFDDCRPTLSKNGQWTLDVDGRCHQLRIPRWSTEDISVFAITSPASYRS